MKAKDQECRLQSMLDGSVSTELSVNRSKVEDDAALARTRTS